jgi:DNA-binding response OmpR family regulator
MLRFADLTLNPNTHEVFRGARKIELTAREFEVLLLFMQHPRQVITRDVLYERIWGYDFGGESNIIEVYVRYLRSKLEEGGAARLIQTVRGVGYALRED